MPSFGYDYPAGYGPGVPPGVTYPRTQPRRFSASYDSSPHSFDSIASQNDALSYWNQVNDANKAQQAQDYWHAMYAQQQQAAQQGTPGGPPGAAGPTGPPAPAMDQFTAAINHVNDQYNAQLSNLDKLTGSARGGVQSVGNETLKRLAALGKDASAQNKSSNAAIKKQYGTAKNEQNAAFQALLADLQRQGAQTQGLGSEEAARLAAIQGAAARQGSTSDRYSQLLSQSLNERGGLARQSTQNSLDDLTKALQTAQFAAQQRKADQLYQIEQERAQMLAAAAAASRGGGGRGGGGRGGGSSGKSLTPSQAMAIDKYLHPAGSKGEQPNYQALLTGSGLDLNDPRIANVANGYLNDIASGKISPQNALINYQSRLGEFDNKGSNKWGDNQGAALGNLLNAVQRGYKPAGGSSKAETRRRQQLIAAVLGQ